MNIDKLQEVYDSYLEAYSDIARDERQRLLGQSVSDNVVFTNPKGGGEGRSQLIEHIEHFQTRNPGASFKSNKLLAHHGQFLLEWTMFKKDGSQVTTAHTYGQFNDQGLLTKLIGFL